MIDDLANQLAEETGERLSRITIMPGGSSLGEVVDATFAISRLHGSRAAAAHWCELVATIDPSSASRAFCNFLRREATDPIDKTTALYVSEWCALQRAIASTGTRLETPSEIEGWFRLAGKKMRDEPPVYGKSAVAKAGAQEPQPESLRAKALEAERLQRLLGLK